MSFYERGHSLGEHISKGIRKAKDRPGEMLVKAYLDAQIPVLKKEFERGGFPAVAAEQLRALNVRADYRLDRDPKMEAMRRRLNTEPGLIISNHPHAVIDAPLILQTLQRKDLQIVVLKDVKTFLARAFGEQYFLPAGKDTIKEIQAHIESGGVSLLFPGGRGDADRNIHFRRGFGEVVKGMAPDSMVYAFYINVSHEQMSKRLPGAASHVLSDGVVNINNFKKPLPVAIDEQYTQAQQWQKVASRAADRKWLQSDFNEYYKKLFADEAI